MKIGLIICLALLTIQARAQFSIEGKLRTLRPVVIRVVDLNGKTVAECEVKSDKPFKTKPIQIKSDLYSVSFGEYTEKLILTNEPLKLGGFLNDQKPENSTMTFDGIDLHMKYLDVVTEFKKQRPARDFLCDCLENNEGLDPVVRASLMYTHKIFLGKDYESYKRVLDRIPEDQWDKSLVIKSLVDEVTDRQRLALGSQAVDFTFTGTDGKEVKLSDFRGKIILIDFWASWCGACRIEMKSLLPIYQELKGDDLVFISISMDNKEADWRRMLEEEKLPWVMLWDKEGFTKGNKPNKIQDAYGFYQIPFIVLIDKEGKLLARDLRGEKVREAIEAARKI